MGYISFAVDDDSMVEGELLLNERKRVGLINFKALTAET